MNGNDETKRETLDRGKREGRVDKTLEEHDRHLEEINGVDREQDREAAKVGRETQGQVSDVASDVRKLGEDQRIRDERVIVARDTLSEQTERRREELATSGSLFTKRQGLVVAAAGLLLTVIGLAFAQGWV